MRDWRFCGALVKVTTRRSFSASENGRETPAMLRGDLYWLQYLKLAIGVFHSVIRRGEKVGERGCDSGNGGVDWLK